MSKQFAIVPVKPFRSGKTRLRSVLSDEERIALSRRLLDGTLRALTEFPGPARTIVVSQSDDVLGQARSLGMIAMHEPAESSLNDAAALGSRRALEAGAGSIFIVPADIPLISAAAIRVAVLSAPKGPGCVIVPDYRGSGTNFLYQSPVRFTKYSFGIDSAEKHAAWARCAGLEVVFHHGSALSFDLDSPEDLSKFMGCGQALAPVFPLEVSGRYVAAGL